jgi:TPR repeat protein
VVVKTKLRRRRPERIAFDALRALSKGEWEAMLAGGPEKAAPWIASAARYGLVEAQLLLGQMLLDRRGIRRDPTSAVRWFAAAADAGCVEAMNMLGRCHQLGWGVRQDDTAAADWYSRAAESGLDWAQYNLANLTLRGRGVARDRAKALWLYRRAADQGHAKSMNMVGRYFEEGWEVARDAGAALEWYRRAARAGDFRGQYNLGCMLAQIGRTAEAAVWLDAAVRGGTADLLYMACAELLPCEEPALRAAGELAAARLV